MTRFEISAAVGWYRCGATFQEIGWLLGIPEGRAKKIIEEYLEFQKSLNP